MDATALTDERRKRGRRSRVVLASRGFPELFQRQSFAQIRRAGLGLSSAVFSECLGIRVAAIRSERQPYLPLLLDEFLALRGSSHAPISAFGCFGNSHLMVSLPGPRFAGGYRFTSRKMMLSTTLMMSEVISGK